MGISEESGQDAALLKVDGLEVSGETRAGFGFGRVESWYPGNEEDILITCLRFQPADATVLVTGTARGATRWYSFRILDDGDLDQMGAKIHADAPEPCTYDGIIGSLQYGYYSVDRV